MKTGDRRLQSQDSFFDANDAMFGSDNAVPVTSVTVKGGDNW